MSHVSTDRISGFSRKVLISVLQGPGWGGGGGGGGGEWVVDELLNCPCRDRAADKLGHRAFTSSYPGKFKRLLSGILFLMLLTIKIRKLVLK